MGQRSLHDLVDLYSFPVSPTLISYPPRCLGPPTGVILPFLGNAHAKKCVLQRGLIA